MVLVAGTWWEYVQRVTHRAQQKDIADATGIEQSTISRWKLGKNIPKAEAVVAVARAYGRAPVEALIYAGYLKEDEAEGVIEVVPSLHDLSIEDLLAEVKRRAEGGPKTNPNAPMV